MSKLDKQSSLLSKASLPFTQSRKNVTEVGFGTGGGGSGGGLKTQSSRLSDVSHSTITKLGPLAGSFTKSLGNVGEGPFDVSKVD
jgi:hypothetical protein